MGLRRLTNQPLALLPRANTLAYSVWPSWDEEKKFYNICQLALSILTDHWESISYIKDRVDKVAMVSAHDSGQIL
jgi:hypothetical protein